MKPNLKIMNILQTLAETVPSHYRGRLAAALVYKNEIISFGMNQMKSHPFQSKFSSNVESIYLHAETDAIRLALKKYDAEIVSKSKLYVCRVKYADTNHTKIIRGLARPCEGCQRAIATFNIKHVCYSTDTGHDFL